MTIAATDGPLVEAVGLSKSYGLHRVVSDVDFRLNAGESVAVIGENGAGKSTFAKMLAGAIRPDGGTLRLRGQPVSFHSPRDALRRGIAFIPQELAYVPHLSVAENILLGHLPSWHGLTAPGGVLRRAARECERYGIDLDPGRRMATLKLADRQIVEIIKALAREAQVIVLDEPTASLSEHESRALFRVLARLTGQGVGIIYISHRMDEVWDFSDRVAVFRNGELVAAVVTRTSTPAQLIAYMLGKEKEEFTQPPQSSAAPAALAELQDWRREGIPALAGVSLTLQRGEIVGLYGIRGSGAELIAEGLGGLRPDIRGGLLLHGQRRPLFASPLASRRARIAYVPPERKRDGLVLALSIQTNLVLLILHRLSRFGIVRRHRERTTADTLARRFDVRYRRLSQSVGQLSGGNQQKVLLANRMAVEPDLLVLQEPTRGVDVGARVEIHRFIAEIAQRGCAVLVASADVEEVVVLSHRLVVMREGRVVGELAGAAKTQANAVALAAGKAA